MAGLGHEPRVSVINVDDPYGVELAERLENEGLQVVRYAVNADADVTARDAEFSLEGMRFNLHTPAGEREFHSPLVGPPHIYNTLAAVASGLALGYDLDVITRALEKCTGAPGRFERVPHDGDFAVVVDYAHSDDALLNVLAHRARCHQRQNHYGLWLRRRSRWFEARADGRGRGQFE